MTRPRIVLDTNVVISAVLQPAGLEAFLIELVASRLLRLYASKEVIEEYRDVLGRPRFSRLDPSRVSHLFTLLAQEVIVVRPSTTLWVSPDHSDNRFLECSDAAEADFLVTGNKRHFPKQWKSTLVVNARELLKALELEIRVRLRFVLEIPTTQTE